MDSLPGEIWLAEIASRIRNPLDLVQLHRTCVSLARNLVISNELYPAWLLDERLLSEVRKHVGLWLTLSYQYQHFPTKTAPFHFSLNGAIVQLKWYCAARTGCVYNFRLGQKKAAIPHICDMILPPGTAGCPHGSSELVRLKKTNNPIKFETISKYEWLAKFNSNTSKFCFYVSLT